MKQHNLVTNQSLMLFNVEAEDRAAYLLDCRMPASTNGESNGSFAIVNSVVNEK